MSRILSGRCAGITIQNGSTHAVGRFLLSGLDCCLWIWQQKDVWMCELAKATRGLMMFHCVFPCSNPKAFTHRCHLTVESGRNCVSFARFTHPIAPCPCLLPAPRSLGASLCHLSVRVCLALAWPRSTKKGKQAAANARLVHPRGAPGSRCVAFRALLDVNPYERDMRR